MNRYFLKKGSLVSCNGNGTTFFFSKLLIEHIRGTILYLHWELFRVI